MKNVIVEGIDCSGKSTLIKNLKFKLKGFGGYDVKALEHKNGDQFRRYSTEYVLADRILFDRAHISEMVFGKILRNHSPLNQNEISILNSIVNNNFLVILAVPSYEDFIRRFHESRELQVISESDFGRINDEFILGCGSINPIIYNSKSLTELDLITNQIVAKLSSI